MNLQTEEEFDLKPAGYTRAYTTSPFFLMRIENKCAIHAKTNSWSVPIVKRYYLHFDYEGI